MNVVGCVAALPAFLNNRKEQFLRSYVIENPRFPRSLTPNQITYFRLALWSALATFLASAQPFWGLGALLFTFHTIGWISDALDGVLARTRGMTTTRGAFMDPIADKIQILVLVTFYLWVSLPAFVCMIGIAEFISVAVRSAGLYRQYDIRANEYGRWKMVSQVLGVYALIFEWYATGVLLLSFALVLGTVSIVKHIFLRKHAV